MLAFAALALTVPSQARADVLVSNIGQGHVSSNIIGSQAQEFTTGDNEAGYTLSSIELHISDGDEPNPDFPTVSLFSGSVSGTLVDTLTAPSGALGIRGNYTFTASQGISLEKDTSYWVAASGGNGS